MATSRREKQDIPAVFAGALNAEAKCVCDGDL